MNVTLSIFLLQRALGILRGSRRRTPNARSVLTAREDWLEVATGADPTLVVREPAEVSEPGEVMVNVLHVHHVLKGRPGSTLVTLQHSPGARELTLTVGHDEYSLQTTEDAVVLPDPSGSSVRTFMLHGSELVRLFADVRVACAPNDEWPGRAGIYLHRAWRDDRPVLRAVATTGRILAMTDTDLPTGADLFDGAIVPAHAVDMVVAMLRMWDEPVMVRCTDKLLSFEVGSIAVRTRPLQHNFPDYQRILPMFMPHHARVARKPLLNTVLVEMPDRHRTPIVMVTFHHDQLLVTDAERPGPPGAITVPCQSDCHRLVLYFDANALLELLHIMRGDHVLLALDDARAPMYMRSSDDPAWLGAIMPVDPPDRVRPS